MKRGYSSCPAPDFKSLFRSAFDLYLVFTADLEIIAGWDVYLASRKANRKVWHTMAVQK